MRREGDVIFFDLAEREGDWLKLGEDLQDHICNVFDLGEAQRRRFYGRKIVGGVMSEFRTFRNACSRMG
jgi:hypothetical protein